MRTIFDLNKHWLFSKTAAEVPAAMPEASSGWAPVQTVQAEIFDPAGSPVAESWTGAADKVTLSALL
ncbi:MAG: hypothetical protein IJK56_08905 [Firmicutes bacterium]|nr:hypothetical protein [Bacillota bacterium]